MFGMAFMIEVFSKLNDKKFPVFDAQTLTLLGLSSATYVAIKSMENHQATKSAAGKASSAKSDELLDPL